MKKILFACALLGLPCVVHAADVIPPTPAPPPVYVPKAFTWTGLYAGVNAGYGSANVSATATFLGASATASETLTGFVGGGQFGALMQWGMGVFGGEVDFQASGQKKSATIFGVTFTDSIPWFMTYRARFGVAFDRILLYGTAGGAYGEFKSEATALGLTVSTSSQRAALTAGAGIEGAITDFLTARLEYLYIDSGNVDSNIGLINVTTRVRDHIVRGAVNFRFGPW